MADDIKYLSSAGLRHYTQRILKIIEDNEYVTAAALTKISNDLRNITKVTNTQNTGKSYVLGTPAVDAYGNIYTQSGVYMSSNQLYATSDERLKDYKGDIDVRFDQIKMIPKKYFTWKQGEDGNVCIGTSAQELLKVYPELVFYDEENDEYGVDYSKLSIVALAAIDKLYEENQILKTKLDNIEERLSKLEK